MRKQHICLLLVFLGLVQVCKSSIEFEAFDCNHPQATFQPLDLLEPAPCPDVENDFEKAKTRDVQIIHNKETIPVPVYQCDVRVSEDVQKCGARGALHNTVYGVQNIKTREPRYFSKEDCIKAVKTGEFTVENQTFHASQGQEFNKEYYTHGSVDGYGNCKVDDFFAGDKYWFGHMRRVLVHAKFKVLRGNVNLDTDKLVVDQKIAEYSKGSYNDGFKGTMAWQTSATEGLKCEDTASASVNTSAVIRGLKSAKDLLGGVVMVDNQEGRFAGFKLTGKTIVCGRRAYTTNIHGTHILILEEGEHPLKIGFDPRIDVRHITTATALGYMTLHTHFHFYDRFEDIAQDLCQVERKLLQTKLQIVTKGNHYALKEVFGEGEGFKVRVQGSVAWVTKCIPVVATITSYDNCTIQIPVNINHDNTTVKFVDPIDKTIKAVPTIVPCDPINPVMWKIGSKWFCAKSPALVSKGPIQQCQTPVQLQPTTGDFRINAGWTDALAIGIFTDEEIQEFETSKFTGEATEAINIKMGLNSVRHADRDVRYGTLSLGLPLDRFDVNKIKDDFISSYFPWIGYMGDYFIYIVGLLFVLGTLLCVVDFVIKFVQGYKEHKTIGCWVFTVFLNGGFAVILMPAMIAMAAAKMQAEKVGDMWHNAVPMRAMGGEQNMMFQQGFNHEEDGNVPIVRGYNMTPKQQNMLTQQSKYLKPEHQRTRRDSDSDAEA